MEPRPSLPRPAPAERRREPAIRYPRFVRIAMRWAVVTASFSGCGRCETYAPPRRTETISAPASDGSESVVVAHGETFHARLFAFDLARHAIELRDVGMRKSLPSLEDPSILLA